MHPPSYAIDVEVEPRFLADQSEPEAGRYVFAYTIRIHNRGTVPASAVIARTDPNEQESVVLLPELDALVPA